nr:MAG TPA: hypothetical protein [Caudoviricetes sp.]
MLKHYFVTVHRVGATHYGVTLGNTTWYYHRKQRRWKPSAVSASSIRQYPLVGKRAVIR